MKNVEDIYALTPLQQLMLLHAVNPGAEDVLLEQFSCTLSGELDAARLRDAWRLVMGRHPALRTCFAWEGLKSPVQVVRRDVELPWREVDLSHTSPADRPERLAELARAEKQAGMNPRTAPLMRMVLARCGRLESHFLWTCHHLIFDGWCLPLLLKEVFGAYQSLVEGRSPLLPPARPFCDYVRWLKGQDVAQSDEYWRRTLEGAPPPPVLAIERTSEEIAAAAAGTPAAVYQECERFLAAADVARLQQLAASHQATLGAIVEAAWAIVIGRYGGSNDVVLGVTVSGRPAQLPGVESIVGPFANTLPLRVKLESDLPVNELLRQVRSAHAELSDHEHSPLPTAGSIAELGANGRWFETVVVLENYPLASASRQVAGLTIRDVRGDVTTNYPLTLAVIPGESLQLKLRYDLRRFAAEDTERMLDHVVAALRAMLDHSNDSIGELSLVSPQEASLLFDQWSRALPSEPLARLDALVQQLSNGETEGADSYAEAAAGDCMGRGWRIEPGQTLLSVGPLPSGVAALIDAVAQAKSARRVSLSTADEWKESSAEATAAIVVAGADAWRELLAAGWNGRQSQAVVADWSLSRRLANELAGRCESVWRLADYAPLGRAAFLAKVERGIGPVALGRPLAGVEAHVLDPRGQPAPIGLPGELCLRFVEAGELIRTGQSARWRTDGQLEWLGPLAAPCSHGRFRLDPTAAGLALQNHPLVQQAFMTITADRMQGNRLAAYIVPAKGTSTLLDAQHHSFLIDRLRSELALRLAEHQTPSAYAVLEEIPRLPSGEVDRAALPSLSRPRPQSAGEYAPARDLLEAQLVALWQEVLGVAPVGVHDDFQDLGGVSVQAVSLASRVEEQFGRKLPLVSVFQQATIANVAQLLRQAPTSAEESCLATIRPARAGAGEGESSGPAQPPLFCVHPAGGTVFCYLELARHLPADQPIYGLQAQGIDGTAAPHETVEEMAAHYIRAMQRVQPRGPYMICGWSSGGILAYEAARQLAEQGESTALLALFDAGITDPDAPFEESDLAPMLKMLFPDEDSGQAAALENLPADEQLAYFRERAEMAQLVVAGADASQARYIFEVFRKNVQAIAQYKPAPYAGKITLFRAQAHATPMHRERELGWARWAAEVEVVDVPGDHVTMFREPTIRIVAERLRPHLKNIAGACS